MEKRLKKVAIISLIVAGSLILGAILLGVANALIADGTWTFGWKDYRYDETGYTVGEGSIAVERVSAIDLDWIDGHVEIVPCDDMFISLSESSASDIPESYRLRWRVDENGTLSVKYRKSAWFFGLGSSGREKALILRIPKSFFEGMTSVSVETVSADVIIKAICVGELDMETTSGKLVLDGCTVRTLSVETVSGDITGGLSVLDRLDLETVSGSIHLYHGQCPRDTEISSVSGKITMFLPSDASFALSWETVSGQLAYDLPLTAEAGRYLCGTGEYPMHIETTSGNLALGVKK